MIRPAGGAAVVKVERSATTAAFCWRLLALGGMATSTSAARALPFIDTP
jgi:hypothetical protein